MKVAFALVLLVACAHGWEVGVEVDQKVGNTETVQVIQAGGPGTFMDFLSSLKGSFSRAMTSMRAQLGAATVEGGDLSLTFKDCGDSTYKAKVTDVTPHTLTLGEATTVTGSGTLSEDISDATFTMKMTGAGGITLLTCSGDAATSQKCPIKVPIIGHIGDVSFEGVTFPIKAGALSGVPKVDIALPAKLPSFAEATTTNLAVTTKSGDKVICVNIMTKADSSTTAAPTAEAVEVPAEATSAKRPCMLHQMLQRFREMHPMALFAVACVLFALALLAGCRYRKRKAALAVQYAEVGSEMQV